MKEIDKLAYEHMSPVREVTYVLRKRLKEAGHIYTTAQVRAAMKRLEQAGLITRKGVPQYGGMYCWSKT
jgi:hypothetical protein